MKYLWSQHAQAPQLARLEKDVSTDVLVIGGGMAGVLCARALTERGADCLLVEANRVGGGVTRGTTAVLTAQHDTLYSDMIRMFGAHTAKQYLDANLDAVSRFRKLSESIPCDFKDCPSVMYTSSDAETLRREADAVRGLGFPAEYVTETELPVSCAGAVKYPGMAQFHPLKFLYGAAEGLKIYENTPVRGIRDGVAYTDHGKIRAKKIIVAAHFPFINRRGLFFMKLYQLRSFVIALENAPVINATYVNYADEGMYFRRYGDLLLVGGGDHRPGCKTGGFGAVRSYIQSHFPDAKEKYAWAAQDCMSLDGVPYIGQYSPATPELLVATGFNEWGMTSSMAASQILADMVEEKENRFAEVFSPQRSMMHAQLFANLGTTLGDFVIPTVKRCPHLGCALRWNAAEHTWDCPCHGSRFDENGKILNNPATKDAKL